MQRRIQRYSQQSRHYLSFLVSRGRWLLLFFLLTTLFSGWYGSAAQGAGASPTPQFVARISDWQSWSVLAQPRAPLYPQMVITAHGVADAIWEENGQIYFSRHFAGGNWAQPQVIATGSMPRLALDANGNPNVVFVNQFMGNFEIFHIRFLNNRWSLPRNVSHTAGASYSPDLSLGKDGVLYAVWTDTTPGYPVIYQARFEDGVWLDAPLRGSMGTEPAVAAGRDGQMHVVWQNRVLTDANDIYHVALRHALATVLPQNVSDTLGQSLDPAVVVDYRNTVHVVWQEQVAAGFEIGYAFGRNAIWSWPSLISSVQGRAEYPTIATTHGGRVVAVGWDDGYKIWMRTKLAGSANWRAPFVVASSNWGSREFDLRGAGDLLYGIWRESVSTNDADLHGGLQHGFQLFTYYYPR